jgi:hypothetical protein
MKPENSQNNQVSLNDLKNAQKDFDLLKADITKLFKRTNTWFIEDYSRRKFVYGVMLLEEIKKLAKHYDVEVKKNRSRAKISECGKQTIHKNQLFL